MAKLHQFSKNLIGERIKRKIFGEKLYDKVHPIGTSLVNAAKVPETPDPIVMPEPDDEATKLARRRSLAQQRIRGGRGSTILSDPSDDPLG